MKLNARIQQVGIDRLIRLQWLEKTAQLVLAGAGPDAIKSTLEEMLTASFPLSLKERRSSVGKTITVLLRTWVRVPQELRALRDSGINLLREMSEPQHLVLHWGMIMACYPFWGAVASQTGRLLQLQGDITAAQVQRRLSERYGERTTVSRRVRYVLRAFIDWHVLKEVGKKGLYSHGTVVNLNDIDLVAWLVEASLWARSSSSGSPGDIFSSTSIFPFNITPMSAETLVAASPRLRLLRHGLDDELIMLYKDKQSSR